MNSAIIVSAGSGSRFASDIPKQFTKLNNKEILCYSVETFLNHPEINEVIIVCNADWVNHVKKNYPLCQIIKGGVRRQDSCLNGINSISKKTKNILIHDAARPFVSQKIISDCLSALKAHDACAPIIPSIDSLISWHDNKASHVDRSKIFSIQTPQCFKKKLIYNILNANIIDTDEIGLLLKFNPNANVTFVKGSINNRKITLQEDLKFFS